MHFCAIPALLNFADVRLDFFAVHHWPAFLTVVCLGLIQIILTYYGSTLTIASLPSHVSELHRLGHRRVFKVLFVTFVALCLLLAKLNDANQYRSEAMVQQERAKQDMLRMQLKQTLDAVLDSQEKLQRIKQVVDVHPPSAERSEMLNTLDQVEQNLRRQASSMERSEPH